MLFPFSDSSAISSTPLIVQKRAYLPLCSNHPTKMLSFSFFLKVMLCLSSMWLEVDRNKAPCMMVFHLFGGCCPEPGGGVSALCGITKGWWYFREMFFRGHFSKNRDSEIHTQYQNRAWEKNATPQRQILSCVLFRPGVSSVSASPSTCTKSPASSRGAP